MIHDPVCRDAIAAAIQASVERVVKEAMTRSVSQEPAITDRVAEALQNDLDGRTFGNCKLRVVAQELPDRGPGALERDVGADLYVGILDERSGESKGFLIQAKKSVSGSRVSIARQSDLQRKCRDMQARTHASYVWIYRSDGVEVLRTVDVLRHPKEYGQHMPAIRIDDQIRPILQCDEGDPRLTFFPHRIPREQFRPIFERTLREMRVPTGVQFFVDDAT
jgi:hypothetical protein